MSKIREFLFYLGGRTGVAGAPMGVRLKHGTHTLFEMYHVIAIVSDAPTVSMLMVPAGGLNRTIGPKKVLKKGAGGPACQVASI